MGPGVWGEFGVCSVPFAVVVLGLVAALNHGALGGRRVDLSRRRRGRVGAHDLSLGRVARLGRVAGLRLDVALLDLGLDDGRRVDDGGRVGQLRLSFFLVLLV